MKYSFQILIFLLTANILAGLAFFGFKNSDAVIINFYDIGQGDGMMIEAGNNIQVIIDGGSTDKIVEKIGRDLPFYDRKIELVIMTHPDKDHLGGLVDVLKYYQVEQVLISGIKCETAICREWDKMIKEKNVPIKIARAGQTINLGGGAYLGILSPAEDLSGCEIKNDNDASVVAKLITDNGSSVLFTGDAGFEIENELMAGNANLDSDILKASHHGSKYATSSEFLKSVSPETAVISSGKNSYGHPHEELISRIESYGAAIKRTDLEGDIKIEIK
jgi:competence protein ComEC